MVKLSVVQNPLLVQEPVLEQQHVVAIVRKSESESEGMSRPLEREVDQCKSKAITQATQVRGPVSLEKS